MRLSRSAFHLRSVLTHAACLTAVSVLIGCATKNPLMEEPVASPAATAPAAVAAAPASSGPVQAANAAGSTPAGVQTSKEKRLFGIFSPYRIDVQQGNFISQEMVSQLQPGMTMEQVRFVLGTPLLTDIFHANRWDYVFRLEKGNGEIISSRIAVHFKDSRLDSVDNGKLPTEQDYLALITGAKSGAKGSVATKPAAGK